MSTHRSSIDRALHPKNIAVIGASDRPLSRGSFIWRSIAKSPLLPNAWAINPKYKYIGERPCFSNISEIPVPIDLAVISLRGDRISQALSEVCEHGVKSVLITPDENGYANDRLWREELANIASKAGVRLIGPDSLGFMSPKSKVNISYWPSMLKAGNIALLAQSGMITAAFLDYAQETDLGFSGIVNTGSGIDVDLPELIDYYSSDPDTRVIALHIEGLRQPREFYSALRAACRKKHVVILKAGADKNFIADRLASFKLGTDAGREDAFSAMIHRAGGILIDSFEEFCAAVVAFATNRLPRGNRLAVIANGSGFAALTATAAQNRDVDLHGLSNETIGSLQKNYPSQQIAVNPVNVGTTASAERYQKTLQLILQDSMIDGAVVVIAPGPVSTVNSTLRSLAKASQTSFKPVITAWISDKVTRSVRKQLQTLQNAPISAVQSPVVAAHAFGYLAQRTRIREDLQKEPDSWNPTLSTKELAAARSILEFARKSGRHFLHLPEVSLLLEVLDIHSAPFMLARTLEEAIQHAEKIGFPVAMKVQAPGRGHQSELNGVHLDLKNSDDVRNAWEIIQTSSSELLPLTSIDGVIVQKMISHHALRELRLAITTDNVLGPVIEFGAGGLGAGIYSDKNSTLPPLDLNTAKEFIDQPRITRTLHSFRGLPPVDKSALAKMAAKLAFLASSIPAIQTLSIDPLVWTENGFLLLDASIRLSNKPLEADEEYSHMPLRPAPFNLAKNVCTQAGEMMLRPLDTHDFDNYRSFLARLSGSSLYYRFQTRTQLPNERIVELCTLDFNREEAWILTDESQTIRASARWHLTDIPNEAEFGIVVDDDWQGNGLAGLLMNTIELSAKRRNISRLIGYVLKNNDGMNGMMKHLGFKREPFNEKDIDLWCKLL